MALEGPARPITSPEEELAYLRAQVEAKERELSELRVDKPRETVAHERILHHRETAAQMLDPRYQIQPQEAESLALNLEPQGDDETMEELRKIMETKGIHNAFNVLEKLKNPHLEDDFHRFLVQYLIAGMPIQGMNEKQPEFRALHMTLYEIQLPDANVDENTARKSLKELISAMEQFYAGMLSVENAVSGEPSYFTLELAVPVNKAHLMFYAAIPNSKSDLFQKQLLAIFPHAHIEPQPNDYNIFTDGGASIGSVASFGRPGVLPLKDYEAFDYDPINSILNAFAKIAPEGEGAALQIMIVPSGTRFVTHYRKILAALRSGENQHKALSMPESFLGEAAREIGKTFFSSNNKDKEAEEKQKAANLEENKAYIEFIERKLATQVVATNMRLVVSSQDPGRAEQIIGELESAFHQFEQPTANRIEWKRISRHTLRTLFHDFSFRTFQKATEVALSLRELTTIFHFPPKGIESSPHLKQSRFTAAGGGGGGGGAPPFTRWARGRRPLGGRAPTTALSSVPTSSAARLRMYSFPQRIACDTSMLSARPVRVSRDSCARSSSRISRQVTACASSIRTATTSLKCSRAFLRNAMKTSSTSTRPILIARSASTSLNTIRASRNKRRSS
jgi:hypothetical protein